MIDGRPGNVTLIGLGHLALFGSFYCLQFILVGYWFYWIARVMQGG